METMKKNTMEKERESKISFPPLNYKQKIPVLNSKLREVPDCDLDIEDLFDYDDRFEEIEVKVKPMNVQTFSVPQKSDRKSVV